MNHKKPKSIGRTRARNLARMATRGEKEIRHEQKVNLNEEKKKFFALPLGKRIKYFYNQIPSKKGKKVFWCISPFVAVSVVLYGLVQLLHLDVAWRWGGQLFHAIFKK